MLANVYKATELYMLQDTSEDHKNTWLFLNRQIKEVLQTYAIFCNNISLPDEVLNRAADSATAIFITVNIYNSVFIAQYTMLKLKKTKCNSQNAEKSINELIVNLYI